MHHGLGGSSGVVQGAWESESSCLHSQFRGVGVSIIALQVLKAVLNQSRPAGARSSDPGMPSSHANSLGYFGTYVALSLVRTSAVCAVVAMTVTVMLVRSLTLSCHPTRP